MMQKQDKPTKKPLHFTPAKIDWMAHEARKERERLAIQARVRRDPCEAQALIDGIYFELRQFDQPVFGFQVEALMETHPFFPKTLKQLSKMSVRDYRLYRAGNLLFDTADHYSNDGALSEAFLDDISGSVFDFLRYCSMDLGYVLVEVNHPLAEYMLMKVPSYLEDVLACCERRQPITLPRILPPHVLYDQLMHLEGEGGQLIRLPKSVPLEPSATEEQRAEASRVHAW